MTSPAWYLAPAGCIRVPRPPDGTEAAPRRPRVCPGLPARQSARESVVLNLAVTLAAVAVVVSALLPGGPAPGPVLTAGHSPLSAAAAPPSPAATAQVIAAYTAFFPALTAAEPQSPVRAAAMLAPHAGMPYLEHVLAQMAWFRARGEVAWGYVVPHVTGVRISGGQAIVRDCQDASNAWLVSAATGQVIPGTAGSARTFLIAVLVRGSDGRWRLTLLAHLGDPCSPVPSPS